MRDKLQQRGTQAKGQGSGLGGTTGQGSGGAQRSPGEPWPAAASRRRSASRSSFEPAQPQREMAGVCDMAAAHAHRAGARAQRLIAAGPPPTLGPHTPPHLVPAAAPDQ